MNHLILSILALAGGIFLAMQGGLNAQLGVMLKSPLLASLVGFTVSMLLALLVVTISMRQVPDVQHLKKVPYYLWFAGGAMSLLGIGLYYYTMPKLGISTMISLGLFGQLIFAVVAGHFGWFGLPVEPVDTKRIGGVLAMILGIFLINNK
ncbi:MAG: DMT family transporter [Bacteroidota bacterium]